MVGRNSSPLMRLPPCVPTLSHLQALRCLALNGARLAASCLPPQLAALRALAHLELRACHLAALPPCVAQLPGLTSLDLGLNRLANLPGGGGRRRVRCHSAS